MSRTGVQVELRLDSLLGAEGGDTSECLGTTFAPEGWKSMFDVDLGERPPYEGAEIWKRDLWRSGLEQEGRSLTTDWAIFRR